MPGNIAPPDEAETADYCLYALADDGDIYAVRMGSPLKAKRFDDIEQALDHVQLQISARDSFGWISFDHGRNWIGYTGGAMDVVELIKRFDQP